MAIQDIKKATVQPHPAAMQTFDEQQLALLNWLRTLSQQTFLVHRSFQQFRVTVAGAAGNVTATLPFVYDDAIYTPIATPNWNTTVYIAAPGDVTNSTVKFTFGTAAPGGGGSLYVLTVR